jgi:hypothetical protein
MLVVFGGISAFVFVHRPNEGVAAGPDLAAGYARAVLAHRPTA